MCISRRKVVAGLVLSLTLGSVPWRTSQAVSPEGLRQARYYPPRLIGLRGSQPGSQVCAHRLARQHIAVDDARLPIEEDVDLVVVGAGISGLSAAYFWQRQHPTPQRILLLDNHDDFGGHARRNEFFTPQGLLLSYGGSESLQSPHSAGFGAIAVELLRTLGGDLDRLEAAYDKMFYPDHGLSRGVYFDRWHFGEDRVVAGAPGIIVDNDIPVGHEHARSYEAFIGDFPFTEAARAQLVALYTAPRDYLPDLSLDAKMDWLDHHSYEHFLKTRVGLDESVIRYFQQTTHDFMTVGIDAVSCNDARACNLPGFSGMTLAPLSEEVDACLHDPYFFHFPDGNASIARMLVRHLIPAVAPGAGMDDIVLAAFDYEQLDRADAAVRLRLSSTCVHAVNTDDGVLVTYERAGKLHRVRAGHVVMAGYNMMIPHIVTELPAAQKAALASNVKAPLVYTNVVLRHWRAFEQLGVHEVYSPMAPYARIKLDFPVSMGGYRHPMSPDQPICLHMMYVPTLPGSGLSSRRQARAGRGLLLDMSLEDHERQARTQLQGMLGEAGFDHERDILAITVNRWAHGYAYLQNTLFDDEDEMAEAMRLARQPIGRIAIANSDAGWSAFANVAIEQAWRAVNELVSRESLG